MFTTSQTLMSDKVEEIYILKNNDHVRPHHVSLSSTVQYQHGADTMSYYFPCFQIFAFLSTYEKNEHKLFDAMPIVPCFVRTLARSYIVTSRPKALLKSSLGNRSALVYCAAAGYRAPLACCSLLSFPFSIYFSTKNLVLLVSSVLHGRTDTSCSSQIV